MINYANTNDESFTFLPHFAPVFTSIGAFRGFSCLIMFKFLKRINTCPHVLMPRREISTLVHVC